MNKERSSFLQFAPKIHVKIKQMSDPFLYTLADPKQLTAMFNGIWMHGHNQPRVAMVGRSNVGKSSLINALMTSKVARVSATPGKTRAIQFFQWKDAGVILADLPGYGFASRSHDERGLWAKLIEGYFKKDPILKGVLLLLDSRMGPTDSDLEAMEFLCNQGKAILPVFTKTDQLKTQSDRSRRTREAIAALEASGFPFLEPIWLHLKDAKALQILRKRVQAEDWI